MSMYGYLEVFQWAWNSRWQESTVFGNYFMQEKKIYNLGGQE